MKNIFNKKVWVIMTKDRKFIAKGVPRNRYLVAIDDEKCTKRIITYGSEGRAKAGYRVSGFFGMHNADLENNPLEAVEVNLTMTEV